MNSLVKAQLSGAEPAIREYRSEDIFQEDREVVIVHGEARYRLQITKSGKLILNK